MECPGPTATLIVYTAILDIPSRHAFVSKCIGECGCISKVGEPGYPTTSVDDDRHRVRTLTLWESELSIL